MIEALLRFYYKAGEDPEAVVATSFAALFWFATVAALIALPFAGADLRSAPRQARPGPDADRDRRPLGRDHARVPADPVPARGARKGVLRGDDHQCPRGDRASPSSSSSARTKGARGLLLGSYVSGAVVVLALIFIHRRRLSLWFDRTLLRRIMRFGLPTMPAELSLYALNFVDRIIIVRTVGLAEAGLYSLAVKFAQGSTSSSAASSSPGRRSPTRSATTSEARRAYAAVVTWFIAGCAFVVIGMWLLSRWIVRALAAPKFFDSYEAIGLIATAVTLYALYMVLLVILGRTGRTEFNFPATAAALAVNVALNLILVPLAGYRRRRDRPRRLLPGRRRADVPLHPAPLPGPLRMGPAAAAARWSRSPWSRSASCSCRPRGRWASLGRIVVWLAYPVTLLAAGFFTTRSARWLRRLRHPAELVAELTAASREPPAVEGAIPEAYEVARMRRRLNRYADRRTVSRDSPPPRQQRLPGMGPVDPGRVAGTTAAAAARTA